MALKMGLDPASSIGNWAQKSGSVKILKLVKIGKKTVKTQNLSKTKLNWKLKAKTDLLRSDF